MLSLLYDRARATAPSTTLATVLVAEMCWVHDAEGWGYGKVVLWCDACSECASYGGSRCLCSGARHVECVEETGSCYPDVRCAMRGTSHDMEKHERKMIVCATTYANLGRFSGRMCLMSNFHAG